MAKGKRVKMADSEVLKHYIPYEEPPSLSPPADVNQPGEHAKEISDQLLVSKPLFTKAVVEVDRIMATRKTAVIKTNQRSTKKWRKSPTKKR